MKKIILTLIVMFALTIFSYSQADIDLSTKKDAISKLSMLVGKWEGTGWASSQDGTRNEFVQSEVVEEKLDGIALLVQGLGKRKGSEEIVHDAIAIITYDDAENLYSFRSHLSTGQSTDATGRFEGSKFIWGFDVPSGTIKYTLEITDGSIWHETGHFSRDGSQWYQFMEMNLQKK